MDQGQLITLANPIAHHYETFVFGNALHCDQVVEANSAAGQHLILCGAGPTLADHAAEWCRQGDQLWGCNSALPYLVAQGYAPTHGITVDQTAEMLEEWHTTPDVEYLLASTVHPHLTELLRARQRRVRFFHNYVGIRKPPVATDTGATMAYEDWLYATLYPLTTRAGSGLNTGTRAIDVALYMGFAKITVLGADCALRVSRPLPEGCALGSPEHRKWLTEDVVMHADGGHALRSNATIRTMGGTIDGRHWETKPDMMLTAVWLVDMVRKLEGRLVLIGDTLPNALRDKPASYLDRLPSFVDHTGQRLAYSAGLAPPDTP